MLVTVTNAAPRVAYAPPLARPGAPVSLSSFASDPGVVAGDPNSDQLLFHWTLGDGRAATGSNPTVAWTAPGIYSVQLTVDDGDGGTTTVSAGTVTVGVLAPTAPDTAGTSFSLAFMPNIGSETLTLFVAAREATAGRVVIPGLLFEHNFDVPAGGIASIELPHEASFYEDFLHGATVDNQRRLAVLVHAPTMRCRSTG